jgi:multidrug efflux pump subunit AcrB
MPLRSRLCAAIRPTRRPPSDRPRVITRPALAASRRPRATLALWGVLLAFGLYAFVGGLDREGFPPVNIPVVVIRSTYFVDDPATIDRDIAVPVSEAYADVEGVDQIRTFSQPNSFVGVVEFTDGFKSPEGLVALEAVQRPDLPEVVTLEFEAVQATKFDDEYDLIVTIAGPPGASASELEEQAALAASVLSGLREVDRAEPIELLEESVNPTTGEPETRQTSFTRYAEPGDIDANDAIGVGVVRDEGANVDALEFSDAVQGRLDSGLGLADDYFAVIGADFADNVRAQLKGLTDNLFFGLVAVGLVSLILIGWRTASLTVVFMATVVLATLLALLLIGYSLNTITLFGLILTLGLLVDDAIVISESIDASRDASSDDLGVIRTAIDRVGAASFAGTLSTLTVLAPMAFVGGTLGEFTRPIPVTVILTLSLSFLLSITLIPAIGRVFLLRGEPSASPIVRAQRRLSNTLGRLAAYPSGHGWRGLAAGFGLVAIGFGFVFASFGTAARVGFDIFPPTKDPNAISISVNFDDGINLDQAREIQGEVDRTILASLGQDLSRYQVSGGTLSSFTFVDLVSLNDRSTASPTHVDRIEAATTDIAGVRLSATPVDVGPPPDEFPFQVQVHFEPDQLETAQALAEEVVATLPGQQLEKSTGDEMRFVLAFVATDGQVRRTDGERILEVRANFDTNQTSSNLSAAEDLVTELWPAAELIGRGLSADALSFDFGQDSDNQDDFASLGVALTIAVALMLVFLVLQFRSIVQPLLVFLAVPFSFFGVFTLLERTDNVLSFFVTVGFIALVGVSVNNSILLVDAANQARQRGASPAETIGEAIERRFRPLVATTATTTAGLLPLALSDPFWEALCYVLIGGLASSTLFVLTAFPPLYLAIETARSKVNPWARVLVGRS